MTAALLSRETIFAFMAANSSSLMSPWAFMSASFCNCATGSSPPAGAAVGAAVGAAGAAAAAVCAATALAAAASMAACCWISS